MIFGVTQNKKQVEFQLILLLPNTNFGSGFHKISKQVR